MADFLTRDALLKKRQRRTKIVTIAADFPDPDLAGKSVTVRSMTARERAVWETQFSDPKTGKPRVSIAQEIRERLAIATVINEKGNQLLTDEDIAALNDVDSAILEAIVKASQVLNDISEDDLAAIEKNLPEDPERWFAFEVALELGHINVDAMLDSIQPVQWEEWKAKLGRLSPIGNRRADLRSAILGLAIDAVVARAAGGETILEPQDLMPFDDLGQDEDDGWEDPALTFAKLDAMAAAQRRR